MRKNYKRVDYLLNEMQSMINDKKRNQFYEQMLSRHVADKTVIEVGFGTGLLSLLAVKLGAKKVLAFEQHAELSRFGNKLIKQLGLENKIELINSRFNTHQLRGDEQVLIHEVFAENLWGEYLFYSLRNSPIPIVPNIYKCRAFVREAVGKELSLTNNLNFNSFKGYHFDPGVDLGDLVEKKKQVIEQELLGLSLEMPYIPLGDNEEDTDIEPSLLFEYTIDTNKQDFPQEIDIDLNLPVGSYIVYFEYSFGDDLGLFCTTDNYEGKSWNQFDKDSNAIRLDVISNEFTFHQTLTNGSYCFLTKS